jgi:hypothetical protein
MEQPYDVREFRKSVRIYHISPALIAAVVVVLFLVFFFLTGSYWLSTGAAGGLHCSCCGDGQ